jgi:hypothetical protein
MKAQGVVLADIKFWYLGLRRKKCGGRRLKRGGNGRKVRARRCVINSS